MTGPVRLRRRELLADRILAGPRALRERLVDHGDERRLQIVAIGEVAPLQQRNPHRLEVVGRDEVEARLRQLTRDRAPARPRRRSRSVPPLPLNGTARTSAADCTPGTARTLLDRALEEARDVLRLRVLALRQPELQREHVRRIEAERHLLHREQALNQQRGHRHQRHRQRHLDDDQDVAQVGARRRTRGGSRPAARG